MQTTGNNVRMAVIASPYDKNQTYGNDVDRDIILRFQTGSVIGSPYDKNQTKGNDGDRAIILRLPTGSVIGNAVKQSSRVCIAPPAVGNASVTPQLPQIF
jgi:hypothetical protein